MSVIGVDIGAHSTYISVAKLGGVEVITNDYSLRPTPSIVAYGDRQRFIGVSAENEKNFNSKNSISNFKSVVGLKFKDVDNLRDRFGAELSLSSDGQIVFQVKNKEVTPEQALATLFTKVKAIVKAASESENDEEIETLVVSVPVYFTQAQRQAVHNAAAIAGLHINQLICDATALALSYGKKSDLTDGEGKKNVMMVDIGSEGTQAVIMEADSTSARILASEHNRIGGRLFDDDLVNFAIDAIEKKYKLNVRDNHKARNRLKNAMEKTKKQMSANTNKIPVQIDSLAEDTDVQISIDRAEFESLIADKVETIKTTLKDLLESTTLTVKDLHSVEIVGGSTRIPIIKQVIEELTGLVPSTTLNADEAVARGCALHAASLSPKFITKQFCVVPAVHYPVEALFVHGGQHDKVLVCDKGESITGQPISIDITADLPLNISLQYADNSAVVDKFISLYKVDQTEAKKGTFNLTFNFNNCGILELKQVVLTAEEKERRRHGSAEQAEEAETELSTEMVACRTNLAFSQSMPAPADIAALRSIELQLIAADTAEIQRQEEKNRLEEQLFKFRHEVQEHADLVGEEEVYTNIIQYFDEMENWLYEEGEGAPRNSYLEVGQTLQKKMKVFSIWLEKFQQMKAMEEEKKRYMEHQQQQQQQRFHPQQGRQHFHPHGQRFQRRPTFDGFEDDFADHQPQSAQARTQASAGNERQIPVVYEGGDEYVPPKPQRQSPRFARRPDPFFSGSPFFNDSLFGW